MATNVLAYLSQRLAVALRDESYATWDSEEMDNLVTDAVADLFPKLSRELPYSTSTITLVSGTYIYSAPTGMLAISRIDWVNTSGDQMGALDTGSWEQVGDPLAGNLKVRVSPTITDQGGTLYCLGYGRYDTTTNLIPNEYVPLVLAIARAEAYRRMAGKRARYEQWSGSEQTQDTSLQELLGLINEADAEAATIRRRHKTWMRPVPARRGA